MDITVQEAYNNRVVDVLQYAKTGKSILLYWRDIGAEGVVYYIVETNGSPLVAELSVRIPNFQGYVEILNYKADKSAGLKVKTNKSRESIEVTHYKLLSVLDALYQSLTRHVLDPNWDIHIGVECQAIHRQRKTVSMN